MGEKLQQDSLQAATIYGLLSIYASTLVKKYLKSFEIACVCAITQPIYKNII